MLKLKVIDEGKIIAEKKGNKPSDFDEIMRDIKIKYEGMKLKKVK